MISVNCMVVILMVCILQLLCKSMYAHELCVQIIILLIKFSGIGLTKGRQALIFCRYSRYNYY